MTNAERLVYLRRARLELERVRAELNLASLACPRCEEVFFLDEGARRLDQELRGLSASLSSWIEALTRRSLTSERVSPDTPRPTVDFTTNGSNP